MMEKWFKIAMYFILTCAVAACVMCLCGMEFFGLHFSQRPLAWLTAVGLLVSVYFAREPRRPERMLVSSLILANAMMLAVLLTFNTLPVSDYRAVFDMARDMADGKFDINLYSEGFYGNAFNYQTGIAWVESLVFRIFGPSFTVLKIINLLVINLTVVSLYYVAKHFVGKHAAGWAALIAGVFYPVLVTVGQPSNQNIEALMMLWLLLLVDRKKFIIAGVLLAVLSLVRPVGLVFAAAFGLWLFSRLASGKDAWRMTFRKAALFFLPWLAVTALIDIAFREAGYVTDKVSSQHLPWHKFYTGLDSSGEHLFKVGPKIEEFDDNLEAVTRWQREEVITAYTKQPLQTFCQLSRKMVMFLGYFDWKYTNVYNHTPPVLDNDIVERCVAVGWGEYFVVLLLSLAGCGVYAGRRKGDYQQAVFIIMTGVYFFIEAWPDYRYDIYWMMFVFAGAGIADGRFRHLINHYYGKLASLWLKK